MEDPLRFAEGRQSSDFFLRELLRLRKQNLRGVEQYLFLMQIDRTSMIIH